MGSYVAVVVVFFFYSYCVAVRRFLYTYQNAQSKGKIKTIEESTQMYVVVVFFFSLGYTTLQLWMRVRQSSVYICVCLREDEFCCGAMLTLSLSLSPPFLSLLFSSTHTHTHSHSVNCRVRKQRSSHSS